MNSWSEGDYARFRCGNRRFVFYGRVCRIDVLEGNMAHLTFVPRTENERLLLTWWSMYHDICLLEPVDQETARFEFLRDLVS